MSGGLGERSVAGRRVGGRQAGGQPADRERGDRQPADRPPADRGLAEYTAEGMLLAVSARGERLRLEVLARYAARLAALSEEQRAAVDAVTRALVARLLVAPAARGTSLAAGPDGARAIRLLRGLYPGEARERPDAPARP